MNLTVQNVIATPGLMIAFSDTDTWTSPDWKFFDQPDTWQTRNLVSGSDGERKSGRN